MSRLIASSTFWPLRKHMVRRPNHRGSSYAQPFLILFSAYSHAGCREAYEDGEDRVQCPAKIFVSSGEDLSKGEMLGKDNYRAQEEEGA